MIMKTLTHDRGSSDCWNFVDSIKSASVYFDDEIKMTCIAVRFKDAESDVVIAVTDEAYLCNDKGQTIERLCPAPRNCVPPQDTPDNLQPQMPRSH